MNDQKFEELRVEFCHRMDELKVPPTDEMLNAAGKVICDGATMIVIDRADERIVVLREPKT